MKSEIYVSTPDYDPTSITDYCHIFDLARKGEFGGLSAGDISVINQLYSGIVDTGPASSGAFPDKGIIESETPELDDSPIVIEKEEAVSSSSPVLNLQVRRSLHLSSALPQRGKLSVQF